MTGVWIYYDVEVGYGEILGRTPICAYHTFEAALEALAKKQWYSIGLEGYKSYEECYERMKNFYDDYIEFVPWAEEQYGKEDLYQYD